MIYTKQFLKGMKLKPGDILCCNPDGTPYNLHVLAVDGRMIKYSLHEINPKMPGHLDEEVFYEWYFVKGAAYTYKQAITRAFS